MLAKLNNRPTWQWGALILTVLAVAGYLAWSTWGPRSPAPGQVVQSAPPPRMVINEPTKTVTVPVTVYRDRDRVTNKLGVPAAQPREEVQTAAVIPRLKYGGTAVTFLNTTTGKSRTSITAAPAPLFSLERNNELSAGLTASIAHGTRADLEYRRDVFQVKGVTTVVSFGASGRVDGGPVDFDPRIGVRLKYSW